MVLLLFTTSVVCARAAGPPVVLVRHRIRAILWWDRTLLALTYPQLGRAQELPATDPAAGGARPSARSEEHTSELQSLMRSSSAVFYSYCHTLSLDEALPIFSSFTRVPSVVGGVLYGPLDIYNLRRVRPRRRTAGGARPAQDQGDSVVGPNASRLNVSTAWASARTSCD